MADYYPLLVRAISSLPNKTGENRRSVYDRARATLVRQLRSVDPPLPEGEITRERLSLEEAIRRVEAEYTPQDNGPAPEAPASAAPLTRAPVEPRRPVGRTEDVPARMTRPAAPEEEERAEGVSERPDDEEQSAPEPESPSRDDSRRESARRGRGAPDPDLDEDEAPASDQRPALRRGEVRSRGAANGAKRKTRKPERGGSWQKLILWLLVAAVVLGGVAFAVVNREAIMGAATATKTAATAPAEAPKSADRVTPTASEGTRPTAGPGRTSTSGTQRAALLEESPGGGQPQIFEGKVTWKTETVSAGPGLPPDIGVRGEVTIPERQISMAFVLRRNTDQTLPASHTIEVSFGLPKDFPFGGIANVPVIGAKQSQQAKGNPLAGLSVKVNPTLFLVGLSQAPQDLKRNLALLQFSPWLDVPMVYTNNKRALIAFEKGPEGDQAFNDAFSAWGELLQRPEPQQQEQQAPADAQQNGR